MSAARCHRVTALETVYLDTPRAFLHQSPQVAPSQIPPDFRTSLAPVF
jgi:hypothetical protein